jgi:hypothetical protein
LTSAEIDEAVSLVTQNGRVFVEEITSFGMRRAAFDRAAERGLIEISPESDGDMRVFTLPPVTPMHNPGASLADLGEAWHGTNTCVNCGCDPQVPVYTLNRGFRFPMGKRARKQVKRAKRTRVGA